MLFVGIDPGLDGAIAALDERGDLIDLVDTPTFKVGNGKKIKRYFDVAGMADILRRWEIHAVALEQVGPMPKQGVTSTFNFGRGFGNWEGVIAALRLPLVLFTPQQWKKIMLANMGKEKEASVLRARQLFPNAELILKKHHNRADALLIAACLHSRTYTPEKLLV